MKHLIRFLSLVLAALLLIAPLPASAEDAKAADLSERCRSSIVLRRNYRFDADGMFWIAWEDDVPATRLCIQWWVIPEHVTLLQLDGGGALLSMETVASLPETVTPLSADCRKVVVMAGNAGMTVNRCAVYGDGTLPDPFHEWAETPDKLDYLLISTHPDDDVLYLGSVIPVYGAEKGYVGTVAYVTCRSRRRMTEAENGAWAMGLRYRPLFLGFPDVDRAAPQAEKDTFSYEELLLATVRMYRTYQPLVVFAQDENGEYGHWQHVLTSKAAVEAATLAADPAYDSESAAQYGTWQVQKVFLHLYEENRIMIDSHAPLSFFDGADAYEVACKAYQKHESQQEFWFSVKRDDAAYAFNRFGMAAGAVPAGEDVFDNIDESLFSFYVPPTPEPTSEPTSEPTPVPTPESTAVPTPVPTSVPTAAPSASPVPDTPSKPTEPMLPWIVLGGLFVCGIACALIFKTRKHAKKGQSQDGGSAA